MIIADNETAQEQTGTVVPGLHTSTNAISVKLDSAYMKGGERHAVSISGEHVYDVKLQDVIRDHATSPETSSGPADIINPN